MDVSDSGKLTDISAHAEKALSPMVVRAVACDKLMDSSLMQCAKAASPMEVMVLGKTTEVTWDCGKPVPIVANPNAPIVVTGFPL